jgi:acyl-CoA synthetase (AMP-forming)/AMP-acid ligase II
VAHDAAARAILAALPARVADIPGRGYRQAPGGAALSETAGARLSYVGLVEATEAGARRMAALGVRPGDRVGIVNENSIAAVVLFFAASAAGAWPILLNARQSGREIDTILDHAGARRAFFTVSASADAATHAARHAGEATDMPGVAPGAIAAGSLREAQPEPVTGDRARDVGCLVYTSGTTGAPKGVMLSHEAALFVASSPGAQRPTGPEDRLYCCLPIAHIFGLTSTLLRGLYGGAEIVLAPRFDAAHLASALATGGITVFQGVPQMYAKLLEHARVAGTPLHAPTLKVATVGGAPTEPELKDAVEKALGIRLVNGWGMTEFASTVSRSLPQHVGRDIAAGPPLPGIQVRIVDAAGRDVPPGAAGEIWLAGPNCMLGYYRNPEATAEVLTPDGWYKTGDIGAVDPDGSLRILDRAREIIIHSGFNVYPAEVEAELTTHPDVTLAAVVGRKVPGNEEVVAFVQPVPGRAPTPAEIAAFVAPRLAPYKRPAEIRVMEALPAAPTGKILKHLLKKMV